MDSRRSGQREKWTAGEENDKKIGSWNPDRSTSDQKVCAGCAGTICLLIKGAKRRIFLAVCQPLF